jgi:hypothetical protein
MTDVNEIPANDAGVKYSVTSIRKAGYNCQWVKHQNVSYLAIEVSPETWYVLDRETWYLMRQFGYQSGMERAIVSGQTFRVTEFGEKKGNYTVVEIKRDDVI